MLFATSLLAFVGAGEQPHLTPRKLTLLNSHSNSVIQSLSFPASVLGVYLNRKRLVAVLERRAFVYDLESLALCGTLDTPHNPLGLAALTSCHMPSCLLALPAEGGMVRVYDVARGGGAAGGPAGSGVDVLCELEAHKAPVTVMAWDDEGQLLATASKKGTVIRVHPVRHEGKALEFRRGSTPATVTCLAFSPPSLPARLLAAASDHGTIHIFRLEAPGRHPEAAAAKSLLSAVMAGVLEPQRPLATVRLPGKGQAAICAVTHEEAEDGGEGAAAEWETRLAVATAEGILYSYRLEVPGGAGTAGGDSSGGGGSSLRASLEGEWSLLTGR
ncbi:Autophagy-related 18 [Chlorella sorokiniana]|uniref:Autophagy-related 18 n=1 Tax=Chlorella sorokiniana TaxID=3076 RepID=A0A2P6TQZ1_CHLSO|nr:Autophagy-related 18 [Chlorella sorokiniana]|eukprot:PRW56485.1 Autophagy-related 18 [Chlorella sorokiniana]